MRSYLCVDWCLCYFGIVFIKSLCFTQRFACCWNSHLFIIILFVYYAIIGNDTSCLARMASSNEMFKQNKVDVVKRILTGQNRFVFVSFCNVQSERCFSSFRLAIWPLSTFLEKKYSCRECPGRLLIKSLARSRWSDTKQGRVTKDLVIQVPRWL